MLRPENAAKNAEYVGYATPNESAKALLPQETLDNPAFNPPAEILQQLEHYEFLPADIIKEFNEIEITIIHSSLAQHKACLTGYGLV